MKNREEIYKHFPYAELESSDGKSRIRICTYSYEFPDTEIGSDADWQLNLISVDTQETKADLSEPVIEGTVLEFLLYETIEFAELKASELIFRFTEPDFSFIMRNENMAESCIEVKGEMFKRDDHIYFEFKTDLKSINIFINGIRRILERFPPRV